MKSNLSAALVIVVLSLTAAYAADEQQKSDTRKSDTMKMKTTDTMLKTESAIVLPAQELKWVAQAEFPEVKMAVVEGDAKKGPHHAFHKFPAGFEAPLHHHSPDYFATVISGTMIINVDGKDYRMGAGSFLSLKPKMKHSTRCDKAAECILFMDTRGAWDVVPEKAAKAGR